MKASGTGLSLLATLLLCLPQLSCVAKGDDRAREDSLTFSEKPSSTIRFMSTQLNPVEEAGKLRNVILKDFPGKVNFEPNDSSYFFSQINSRLQADPSSSMLLGALHGDLVRLYEEGALLPLNEIYRGLQGRGFIPGFVELSRLGGKDIYYIPWMQASYAFVVNNKALRYLPEGADVEALTYEQLSRWAAAVFEKEGKMLLGFPAGEKGLMHRFLQGYLYPSFTGSTLLKFRAHDAVGMWEKMRELWKAVYPGSLNNSTMADPLLAGDVWIAWDHTARLAKVFQERPNDFIAIPAPIGPKGRGYMAVVSGLAIPKLVQSTADQALLIDYLTRSAIQIRTLRETGFFPVVAIDGKEKTPRPLDELGRAVQAQAGSANAIPTLLPIGLGERGDEYNGLFMLTFSDIVLGSRDISSVLDSNARKLQRILDETGAKSWLPDVSEARPSHIE
jgi:multiple sugar transport system substrate-binding protein